MNLDWGWYEDFDICAQADMADLEGWSGTITGTAAGWDGLGQSIFGPSSFFRTWASATYGAFVIRARFMQVAWGTKRLIFSIGVGSTVQISLYVATDGHLTVETGTGTPNWTSTGTAYQNG